MQISKLFNCIIYLSLMTLASSCTLPKPNEGLKNSTFQVESVDGIQTNEELGDLGMPHNKTYQINVCLKDTKTQQFLINQNFDILGGEKNKTVLSDEKGCLHWSEQLSFNSLSDSKYLEINRDIVGKVKNSGTYVLKIAINPWLDAKEAKIVDLTKSKVSPLLTQKDQVLKNLQGLDILSGQKIKKNLWAEDGRLFVLDEQFLKEKGVQLTFDIRLNPAIILKKLNGEKYFQPLTDGKLKAKFYLFSTTMNNGKNERIKLASSGDFKSYPIKNNQISVKEQLILKNVPKRGQIIMAVHLKSDEESLQQLKDQIIDFKGVYPLGEYDSLKNTAFLKVASEISDSQSENETELNFEASQDVKHDSLQKAKYDLSPIEGKFLRILSESVQSRKISFNVKLCMINGIDHKPLRGESIQVTSDTYEKNLNFDINACLSIDDTISFDPLSCQHFIKKDYKLSSSILGVDEMFSVLINPWEITAAGSIRDYRYAAREDLNQLSCSKEKNIQSHLQIDNFHYTQNALNYNFDKNLSLEVVKSVFIKMEPKIIVPSSFTNGTSEIIPLRNGPYRVRIAVIRNQKNILESYLTHVEKFVNVVDGKVNSLFDIHINELKQLGVRNNVLIDIAPLHSDLVEIKNDGQILPISSLQDLNSVVDEKSPLAKGLFIGTIILNNDQSTTPLMPLNNSDLAHFITKGSAQNSQVSTVTLSQIIERGLQIKMDQQKQISKLAQRNYFATLNNLEVISIKHPTHGTEFFKNWKSFPTEKSTNEQLNNDQLTLEKTQLELNSIVDSNKITLTQNQKLCSVWTSHILKNYNPEIGGALHPTMKDSFNNICLRYVTKKPFFIFEKRYFVHETGETELVDGRNFNINTGTNFAVSRTHTESTTRTTSLTVNAKVPDVITQFLPLNASLNYNISSSTQNSESEAFSTNFGSNMSLVVQQNLFKVQLNQYEQCLIVKINPEYLMDRKLGPVTMTTGIYQLMNSRMSTAEKIKAAQRGLLLCKGQIESKQLVKNETQFVIFQDLKNTEIQDSGNEKLRSFYLSLRGSNDYVRFVNTIKGQSNLPTEEVLHLKADEQQSIMSKLNDLIHKAPTHPGVYYEM